MEESKNYKPSTNPSESKTNEGINKELLAFYYCPKCHQIPNIKIGSNYISIECYGVNEGEKIQKEINEITNEKELIPFAEYKRYKILIETFNQIINNNISKSPLCEASNHGIEGKHCHFYCSDCNIFICKECFDDQVFHSEHKLLNTVGMRLNYKCSNIECKSKIEFYCLECKKQYCSNCILKDIHSNHSKIKIIEKYPDLQINQKLNETKKILESKDYSTSEKFRNYLNTLKEYIKECEVLLKEQEQKEKYIQSFYNSLNNTFISTKEINNYQVRNNIICNNVNNTLNELDIQFRNKLYEKLTNPILLESFSLILINQNILILLRDK